MTSASPVAESQEEAEMRAATDEAQAESQREASASPARVGGGKQEVETGTRTIAAWIGGVGPTRLGQRRSDSHTAEQNEQRAAEQSRRKGTPSLDAAADWIRGGGRGARGPWEPGGAMRGEGPESSRSGRRRHRGSTPRSLRTGERRVVGQQLLLLLSFDWSRRRKQAQGADHQ